ncbi:MAG: DUF2934 domain-containing protein [Sterolibacterium sp.]
MATASKTSKPVKTAAPAKPKAAPRAAVKAKPKTATAPVKSPRASGVVKKSTPVKAAAAKPAASAKPAISEDQRRHYIEVAAYFIAERRGFPATSALEDWNQAEAEIDRLLSEGKLNA